MVDEGLVRGPVNHFRGRSDHTLDGKGRLSIPSRFRDVLRRQYDEGLMVTPWHNCLKAYPLPQWEELEMTLLATGRKQPDMIKMVRFMLGGVVECSLDKQGRILLPPKLREDCNIQKEVLVSGMISYFEIWDKSTWESENKPSVDDFQSFERNLLEMGLL
ncbi:MAG: division/cell wall cluster transcriptional repressor MraZ [Proteobacteria bacterium]|nr:division/cell wall cluster transcriptional repressor MraZ [Pseudomonadota bacterium]MBU1717341.1 division/cell wall cluster transcriptional repressor MraZ [Pseudomonadota bacterium]